METWISGTLLRAFVRITPHRELQTRVSTLPRATKRTGPTVGPIRQIPEARRGRDACEAQRAWLDSSMRATHAGLEMGRVPRPPNTKCRGRGACPKIVVRGDAGTPRQRLSLEMPRRVDWRERRQRRRAWRRGPRGQQRLVVELQVERELAQIVREVLWWGARGATHRWRWWRHRRWGTYVTTLDCIAGKLCGQRARHRLQGTRRILGDARTLGVKHHLLMATFGVQLRRKEVQLIQIVGPRVLLGSDGRSSAAELLLQSLHLPSPRRLAGQNLALAFRASHVGIAASTRVAAGFGWHQCVQQPS